MEVQYDGSHRMTSMVNGLGGEAVNTYNGENQVITQKEPSGTIFKWEYAPFVTKVTNEATSSVTLDEYTSEYQLAAVTHGYGTEQATTESFTYNERGEPLTRTDGNGHTTSYEYNAAGDRTLETDPEGHETKWAYNAHHQVTSETLPSGETTSIEYDEHGDPIKVSRPAPKAETQETHYEYNAAGEMTAMIDPLSRKWTYEYDSYGDRTVEVDPEGDKRTWGFNEDSQQTSEVSPRGNVVGGEPAKYTTSIERDAQGLPVKLTEPEASQGKPANRMRAAVSGETIEGQTLTAAPGIWEGAPTLSYSYQWEHCNATGGSCTTISGATGSTYVLASADLGHTIRVVVTATNLSGSASSTSAVTAVVSTVVMPRYSAQFGSKGSGAGQLAYPYGIAVDSHGNVWVDDSENNRVEEFSSTGTFTEAIGWGVSNGESKYEVCTSGCRAGLKGSGEGEFNEPAGLTVSGGNLYVVDFANDRVEEFNEKSEFVRAFGEKGTGAGQFEGPEMVAAASGRNVWVSDTADHRVEEFSSSGTFIEAIGWGVSNGEGKYEVCMSSCRAGLEGSGSGEFNTPVGVAVDGSNLYVADDVNDRVEEFNEKSEYARKFSAKGKEAGQFEETTNLGVEASTDDLYANDWGDNRVEQFTSTGSFIGQFGASGTGNGQFKGPQGVAVNSSGGVYVVDSGNDRVQEWKPVSTPANVVVPIVSGEMIEGQTLTAGTGIWAASPAATYTYQWQRCTSAGASCANVTGATSSTYALGSADIGHQLRVQVTAKNTAGSTKASSHTTQTPASAHITKYVYDAEGQIESETDAEGQTTTTTYNSSGLPIKVSYPGGQTTETEYDGAEQVVAQIDGNKHTISYKRNVLEQVTEVIDPLSRKTKKTYDAAGNLATLTDPEGRITTYSYNKENQVTKVSYSEAGMHTVEYAYTPNGYG
jgi:YD repeat-containing protein